MTLDLLNDVEHFFKDCMINIDHPLDDDMQFNTGWLRYACCKASKGNANVAYKVHTDGQPFLKIQCHKCHPKLLIFKYGNKLQLTDEQRSVIQHKYKKRNANDENARKNVLIQIRQIWNNSTPCLDHAYFEKKGLSITESDGLRIDSTGRLLCPVRLITVELVSLQTISREGKKLFYKRTSPKNGFHVFGLLEAHDEIFFAESVGTALAVKEAVNKSVIVCYGKHFDSIALIIRKHYLNKKFVFCADLDKNKGSEDNVRKAISLVGGCICLPDFSKIPNDLAPEIARSDYADLFLLLMRNCLDRTAALDEVRQQIQQNSMHGNCMIEMDTSQTENLNAEIPLLTLIDIANKEPQALPDTLLSVLPFDLEMLPESIRVYISDVAERQQCPIDFVAVTAICGLAALLGRKALIKPKQNDDWTVSPNLWGVIIGRPSAMKSPAMNAALEPLKRIDSKAAKEYELTMKEHQINKEFLDVSKTSAREKARKLIKDNKHADAKVVLNEATFYESPPTRKRLIVNDTTVEKLGELLNENENGLILVRDELSGWLSKLAREEFQPDRAFYIECFNGNGSFIYDRIGRGTIDIKNLTLSIIGGIQPSRINPLIRDSVRGVSDDGLVQRLQVAVWPEDIGNWEWIDRTPNKEARASYFETFDRLHTLNLETENGEPRYFRFSPEAQELFIAWMNEIQKIARADDTHPALESHLLKMPETVASLALLFEIVNGGQESVGVEAAAMALDWSDYLRSHADRLYSAAVNQGLMGAHLILKRIDKLNDEFSARDIQRRGWAGLSESREIEEALSCLVDYKHLSLREIPSTASGGRPTTIYSKNKKYTNGSIK